MTGNSQVIEGYVQDKDHKSKDLNEYVMVKGMTISFLLNSELEIGKKYRISYLPNTLTGISKVEIEP